MPERIQGKDMDTPVVLAIVSDTHGDTHAISQILSLQTGPDRADALIHLGDMESIEWITMADASIPVYAVAGNNDPRREGSAACRVFDAGGLRFICVHGHLQKVKSTLSMLGPLADSCNADVVAYGHTHGFRAERVLTPGGRNILLMNPGAAYGLGRAAWAGYAILSVSGRHVSIHRITTHAEFTSHIDLS
jgi:putative phosphoesterase